MPDMSKIVMQYLAGLSDAERDALEERVRQAESAAGAEPSSAPNTPLVVEVDAVSGVPIEEDPETFEDAVLGAVEDDEDDPPPPPPRSVGGFEVPDLWAEIDNFRNGAGTEEIIGALERFMYGVAERLDRMGIGS